ncbi:MAG TPA: hypothetical protein VIG71_11070 [Enteractinococcus sp.]
MSLQKTFPAFTAVCALLALSGCGAAESVNEAGDPPEVTCQGLQDAVEQFSDIDPASMGFGDILAHVSEGFSELETIADDARDDRLAQSIDTMRETLNSSIAASGGNIDAVRGEVEDRLQETEVQDAATYIKDTCGTEIAF